MFQRWMMIRYHCNHSKPSTSLPRSARCHRGKKGKTIQPLINTESTLDQGSRYGFNIDFTDSYSHLKNAMKALARVPNALPLFCRSVFRSAFMVNIITINIIKSFCCFYLKSYCRPINLHSYCIWLNHNNFSTYASLK